MDVGLLLLIVAVVVVASRRSSGAGSSSASPDVRELARNVAIRAGVDPNVWLAMITVESNWNPDAVNQGPGDAARGGAWGLSQITVKTAQAVEPGITGPELLDVDTHLRVAEALLTDIAARALVAEDVPSLWNSGRRLDSAPDSTRYIYVPKVMRLAKAEAEARS